MTPAGGPGWDGRGWEETSERWEERCEVLAGMEGWQRMKLELLGAGALNAGCRLRLGLNGSEGDLSFFHVTQPLWGEGRREKTREWMSEERAGVGGQQAANSCSTVVFPSLRAADEALRRWKA